MLYGDHNLSVKLQIKYMSYIVISISYLRSLHIIYQICVFLWKPGLV